MLSRVLLPVLVALGLLVPACQRTEAPAPAPAPTRRSIAGVADVVVQLRTNSGRHWVVAEDAGGTEGVYTGVGPWRRPTGLARADRTSPQGWETFPVRSCEAGLVGFQAPNGAWLSAQPDGTLVFNRHRVEPYCPAEWEGFRVQQLTPDSVALVTWHGTYLRAPRQGGGELRHDQRDHADVDETFWPSAPLRGPPPPPPPPPGSPGIVGQLRIEQGGGYADDRDALLPLFWHYGDAASAWVHGRKSDVHTSLARIKAAGYVGIRVWSTLGLDDRGGGFWAGYQIGPTYQANYWEEIESFLVAVRDHGLVVHLAQGDVRPVAIPDRRDFAHRMAHVAHRVGLPVIALFEGANESRDTGEPDARRLAEFVRWFQEIAPQPLRALSSFTGTEDVRILNEFGQSPAQLSTVHGYRGGRWWDKVRHVFSLQYEFGRLGVGVTARADPADLITARLHTWTDWAGYLERHFPDRVETEIARGRIRRLRSASPERAEPRLIHRLLWQGEPPGPGQLVSAIDNRHEMTAETQQLLAATALMTRQAYVGFSGWGVKSNGPDRLEDMPGFLEIPRVRDMLPYDVMRYAGPFYHSGDTWRDRSPFIAAAGDRGRADCVDHPDGRVACVLYGTHPGEIRRNDRIPLTLDRDTVIGSQGRVVFGRKH